MVTARVDRRARRPSGTRPSRSTPGSGDGVAVNDPVINGDGLIGQVTDVTHGTAKVTLITDSRAARCRRRCCPNGPQGVVEPEAGDPKHAAARLHRQERADPPGSDGRHCGVVEWFALLGLPADIPIGRGPGRRPCGQQETTQNVHITPYADMRNLDIVQVADRRAQRDRGSAGDRHPAHRAANRADRDRRDRPAGLVLLLPDAPRSDAEHHSARRREPGPPRRRHGRRGLGIRARVPPGLGAARDARRLLAGPADRRLPGRPLPRGHRRSRTRSCRRS